MSRDNCSDIDLQNLPKNWDGVNLTNPYNEERERGGGDPNFRKVCYK